MNRHVIIASRFFSTAPAIVVSFVLLLASCAGIPAAASSVFCDGDAVDLEPDIRFGAEDEDDPGFLYIPASVAVDSSGNVFILDHARQSIVKFDRRGNHVLSFSREGEGPGELRSAFQMTIGADDEIVVYDPGNRRLTFFDSDGEYLRSVGLSELGYDFVAQLDVGPNGAIYMEIHHIDRTGDGKGTSYAVKRFSPDLESHTVVDSMDVEDNFYITKPVRTNVPVPFPPALYWDIAPSGDTVVGHSDDYTLKMFSAEGALRKTVRHEGTRLEVTEQDREEHFAGITHSDSSGHISRGAAPHIRKATEFPRHKPYFRGLRVDTEGNILVATYETDGDTRTYDVFDPDGGFACRAKLPEWFQSSILSGRNLYRIEMLDDGSSFVRRHRLAASAVSGAP